MGYPCFPHMLCVHYLFFCCLQATLGSLCKLHLTHMGGVSGSCSVISQSSSQLPIIDAAPREHFPPALYLIIIHHGVPQLFLAPVWTGSQAGGSPVGITSSDFREWKSYMITFPEEKHGPVCCHDPFQAVLTQTFPPLRGGLA